ncbi:MAG: hypothetical protein II336_08660 [Loktanella sp.]|nr:hypothetical protein [Loktanella sp.]
MLDRVLALFAFVVLCIFLGVLVFKLQRLDITIVTALAVLLAGWDMLGSKKS